MLDSPFIHDTLSGLMGFFSADVKTNPFAYERCGTNTGVFRSEI